MSPPSISQQNDPKFHLHYNHFSVLPGKEIIGRSSCGDTQCVRIQRKSTPLLTILICKCRKVTIQSHLPLPQPFQRHDCPYTSYIRIRYDFQVVCDDMCEVKLRYL